MIEQLKTKYGNFIIIPRGSFLMGNEKAYSSFYGRARIERIQARKEHRVILSKNIAVLETPVTVSQYKLFLISRKKSLDSHTYYYLSNKDEFKEYCHSDKTEFQFERKWSKGSLLDYINDKTKQNYPIIGVNYFDCLNYCNWLSSKLKQKVRLLSEAEWEYSCKSGKNNVFHWGNNIKSFDKYSWCCINSNLRIQETKKLAANSWGLYDITGNVWEWCLDKYGKNYYNYSPIENPLCTRPNCKRFSIRGGSSFNKAETCRSTHRFGLRPETRNEYLGFRILIELK